MFLCCYFLLFSPFIDLPFCFLLLKGSPDKPRNIKVTCDVKTAEVKWTSSFNGGDRQSFTAFALTGQQEASRSELIQDEGENKNHSTSVLNLQPSTEYVFYVSAQNRRGNSSSEHSICKTLPEGITHDYHQAHYTVYIIT